MGRIPRIEQDNRPSSVVGGAPRVDTGAADITGALGKLAGTGSDIAADMEAREAKTLQDALDKKQAIVDTVDTARRVADFGEESFGRMAHFQEQFRNEPAKAVQPFIEDMRKRQDEAAKGATNAEVALGFARGADSENAANLNEMHRWAQTQMTQNTKAGLEEMASVSLAKGARTIGGVDTLAAVLERHKTNFGSVANLALGPSAGTARTYELNSDTTYAYFDLRSADKPAEVLEELKATSGPAAEYLTAKQRATLEEKAAVSAVGLPRARQRNDFIKGITKNSEISAQIIAGKLNPEDLTILARAATKNREIIALDKDIGEDERKIRLAAADEHLNFLEASDAVVRGQPGYEVVDKPGVVAEIRNRQAEILKTAGAKVKLVGDNGLPEILRQYTALALAEKNGVFTKTQAAVYKKQLDLAMPQAYDKAKDDTWHWGLDYQDANEVGHSELNKQFKFSYPKATISQQNDAWLRFTASMNDAADSGASTSKEKATRYALESVALAMKQDPNGLFKGKAK